MYHGCTVYHGCGMGCTMGVRCTMGVQWGVPWVYGVPWGVPWVYHGVYHGSRRVAKGREGGRTKEERERVEYVLQLMSPCAAPERASSACRPSCHMPLSSIARSPLRHRPSLSQTRCYSLGTSGWLLMDSSSPTRRLRDNPNPNPGQSLAVPTRSHKHRQPCSIPGSSSCRKNI